MSSRPSDIGTRDAPSTAGELPYPNALGAVLQDAVVLVTGGGRGIGAAIARGCAMAGAKVVVAARTEPVAVRDAIVGAGGRAVSVRGDVSNPADAERLVDYTVAAFGRIDVLVNNAGIADTAPLLEMPVEMFDRTMAVNLRGSFLMTQSAGRRMVQQVSGVIINIGSDLAMRGRAQYAAYAASKGALLQLTRTTAIELGTFGIRAVMLSPAITRTEMAQHLLDDPQTRADLLGKGTLGRVNEPEDIAAAAVFLASSHARTITGCNWPVDAGVLAR